MTKVAYLGEAEQFEGTAADGSELVLSQGQVEDVDADTLAQLKAGVGDQFWFADEPEPQNRAVEIDDAIRGAMTGEES